ncbi:polysaccharide deacetylase family protein [Flavihumibacter profundi]|uniref:polysaccharide deacetylase family protein n=1 Tax=Flavihumibacter profundi TaxID=2716883 RepID=UPI001CC3A008|nr:polysaccharide deacetylase family protein [Flavihumibacter profundi]MBZ5857443.1 polysaccharide deacetylase family protein [Flavihumibacter profundi]
MKTLFTLFSCVVFSCAIGQADTTYAERLGFPKGAKVIIFHVDDAGMSYDSDLGAFKALTDGVASSVSVMMPCPWVPHFVAWLKQHPNIDAGLHLTLTSEWKNYKWGPLAGAPAVPGLVDTATGAMYAGVEDVVKHAKPDEVGKEMRAQVKRAFQMGFVPTHLDSHMGTLFADPGFLMQYVQLGIELQIPVMMPGGHDKILLRDDPARAGMLPQIQMIGKMLWKAGLPVLDDLHNNSYDWVIPESAKKSDAALQKYAGQRYIKALEECQPGLTMMIMHCTNPTEVFAQISDSGPTRKADMLGISDPAVRKYIKENGIIITTWREVMKRRQQLQGK